MVSGGGGGGSLGNCGADADGTIGNSGVGGGGLDLIFTRKGTQLILHISSFSFCLLKC